MYDSTYGLVVEAGGVGMVKFGTLLLGVVFMLVLGFAGIGLYCGLTKGVVVVPGPAFTPGVALQLLVFALGIVPELGSAGIVCGPVAGAVFAGTGSPGTLMAPDAGKRLVGGAPCWA